jgi:hypothetical protein
MSEIFRKNRMPNSQDAETLMDWLNSCVVEACNVLVPKRVVHLRGKHEFENSRIAAMKKKRDRAWKAFKKTNNHTFWLKSKSLSKKLKEVIKKEQKRVFRAKM